MPHPVVHFEIGCRDKDKIAAFYREAFGWTVNRDPMGTIDTGSTTGIAGHITALGHEPHNFTHFYIETPDVAESLRRVEARGGRTVVPPVTIASGTFAWFSDMEGNIVGLWSPAVNG